MRYAGQPSHDFVVSEVAASIWASKPMPAITVK
jgi:hypothetical protein